MLSKSALVLIAAVLGINRLQRNEEYLKGTTTLLDEYDFIIVGGGNTGLVVANRLSEDENTTVLIIEAGGSDYEDEFIGVPGFFSLLFYGYRQWNYKSTPQEASRATMGQRVIIGSGKVLGGATCTNAALYIRASKHDFDSWEDHGALGWNSTSLEPFYQKIENASDNGLSDSLGQNGKVKITWTWRTHLNEWFKQAATAMGYPIIDSNTNGADIGFSLYSNTVYKGRRQTSSVSYFWPVWKQRSNRLHLALNSLAEKVLLETDEAKNAKVAVGVQYRPNGGNSKVVRARKEIILSAGAIGSPKLLMLSGIGPRSHLEEFSIPVEVDLPGVGSNLEDHAALPMHYYVPNIPGNIGVTVGEDMASTSEYFKHGNTSLHSALYAATFHFNTRYAKSNASLSTVKRPFPELMLIITTRTLYTIPIYPITLNYKMKDWRGEFERAVDEREGILSSFKVDMTQLHPKSRGTIRLQSADPEVHPLIDPKYMSNPDDEKVLIEGYRFIEELMKQKPFSDYNVTLVAQPYCDTSENNKIPRSDDFYRCLIHTATTSIHHFCSTAKMGRPEDPMSVLDQRLRVRGVNRLRVADASVMPHSVSGNPMATCYLIGEKAADLIKDDWE